MCEIHAFPAERSQKARARAKLNNRTEEDFRAKARPLRADDLPKVAYAMAGEEYAAARLRDAARVYASCFGHTATAIMLGELLHEAHKQATA
jgi:hypothetical protein